MGEPRLDPNWPALKRLISVAEVALILGRSKQHVCELRRRRVIKASTGAPYRFDPAHIWEVFFSNSKEVVRLERSLKIEEKNSDGHKPVKKGDLWRD